MQISLSPWPASEPAIQLLSDGRMDGRPIFNQKWARPWRV